MELGAVVPTPQTGVAHSAEAREVREDLPESGLDVQEAGACAHGNCGRRPIQGVVTE